jgi:hypothetical protein
MDVHAKGHNIFSLEYETAALYSKDLPVALNKEVRITIEIRAYYKILIHFIKLIAYRNKLDNGPFLIT